MQRNIKISEYVHTFLFCIPYASKIINRKRFSKVSRVFLNIQDVLVHKLQEETHLQCCIQSFRKASVTLRSSDVFPLSPPGVKDVSYSLLLAAVIMA